MEELNKFYKENENDKIWWVYTPDRAGEFLFSFDKKTIFNFWDDYPQNLTSEQKEIFDAENPCLKKLFIGEK